MAIFSKKTEKEEKVKKTEKTVKVKTVSAKAVDAKAVDAKEVTAVNSNPVILSPYVTEKASIQSEASNIYTFKVAKTATKDTIFRAIKTAYKVTPLSIRIARRPEKPINYRGRPTTKAGFKKAFVHLKKGDKIEFA